MSIRYEYVDTSHPFLSVTVQPDPSPDDDDFMGSADGMSNDAEGDDVLVIAYDEAFVVTGDLAKFASMVQLAVHPEFHDLLPRVYDALVGAGHRALADEFGDVFGAGR